MTDTNEKTWQVQNIDTGRVVAQNIDKEHARRIVEHLRNAHGRKDLGAVEVRNCEG